MGWRYGPNKDDFTSQIKKVVERCLVLCHRSINHFNFEDMESFLRAKGFGSLDDAGSTVPAVMGTFQARGAGLLSVAQTRRSSTSSPFGSSTSKDSKMRHSQSTSFNRFHRHLHTSTPARPYLRLVYQERSAMS